MTNKKRSIVWQERAGHPDPATKWREADDEPCSGEGEALSGTELLERCGVNIAVTYDDHGYARKIRELEDRQTGGYVGFIESYRDPGTRSPRSYRRTRWWKRPTTHQGYLGTEAGGGIELEAVRGEPGADGCHVRVFAIEEAWLPHDDLPVGIRELRLPIDDGLELLTPGWDEHQHGNSLLGVLCATSTSSKIRGIAPGMRPPRVVPFGETESARSVKDSNLFVALAHAIAVAEKGDLVVAAVDAIKISVHGRTVKESGRLGLEAFEAARCMFHYAARKGVYVVTAAGNGNDLLDVHKEADDWSPVLVVGGGEPKGREKHKTSNFGERVDLHSWGRKVASLSLREITDNFNGTSSATAIVAGVVAIVVSHIRARTEAYPEPAKVFRLLKRTAYGKIDGIGGRPSLKRAFAEIERYGPDLAGL